MKKPTTNKRILVISIVICALAILLVGTYTFIAHAQRLWPYQPINSETPTTQNDDLNNSDPTYTSEKTKDDKPAETPTPPPTTENGKKSVSITTSPTVIDGYVEVRSTVSGVIEDGGTCTAVFSKDGTNLSYSSSAFTNVSSTQCELIKVNVSDFVNKGTWQVKVSYSSTASEGSSSAVEVKI